MNLQQRIFLLILKSWWLVPSSERKNIGGVYTEGGDSTGKVLKNTSAIVRNSKNDSDNKFQIKGAKPHWWLMRLLLMEMIDIRLR